jgi:hypothetical protein
MMLGILYWLGMAPDTKIIKLRYLVDVRVEAPFFCASESMG